MRWNKVRHYYNMNSSPFRCYSTSTDMCSSVHFYGPKKCAFREGFGGANKKYPVSLPIRFGQIKIGGQKRST